MELFGAFPLAQLSRNGSSLDDLNAWRSYPVPRSHLGVHLFHSTIESGVTIFLVHVMIPSSALVAQPDAIVLDFGRILLKDLQRNKIDNLYSEQSQTKRNSTEYRCTRGIMLQSILQDER